MIEQEVEIKTEQPETIKRRKKIRPELIVPISILLGCLFISASVLIGSQIISKKITKSFQGGTVQNVGSLPTAQVPLTPDPLEIKSRSTAPVLGKESAKVTIIEFADFQCPYCKQYFQQTSGQIKENYVNTGKVKLEFRHYPLNFHVNAEIAGIAAECANEQGKFWEYHDKLFTDGQSDGAGLDADSLKKYADAMGLNKGTFGFGNNKFNNCLDTKATQKVVQQDNTDGATYGVSGTPSFMILKNSDREIDMAVLRQAIQSNQNVVNFSNGNSVLVGAQPYSVFQTAIEKALAE